MNASLSLLAQAIAAVAALGLYFLPSILADRRKRHDVLTLALFNACLGWTVFGWLLALYWSLQPNPPNDIAGEVGQTRRVVRMRAFSAALLQRVQKRANERERSGK
jgi:Na+/melibiose symporter-like transporter